MINPAPRPLDDQAVKQMAKRIRTALAADGISIGHSAALELVARQFGARDWNTLAASFTSETDTTAADRAPADPIEAIPILRIFDVDQALAFYGDYLGFGQDWEHRFEDHLPLYTQVSRGGTKLHLSEHHGDGSPGTAILLTTPDVRALHAELQSRPHPRLNPGLEEEDWGLTLTVIDPFSNRLTFHQPVTERPERVDPGASPWRYQRTVSRTPEVAFAAFTTEMGHWWEPGRTQHGADHYTGVDLEPRAGGRVAFTFDDFPDQVWGRVAVWDPPHEYVQDFWLAHDPEYPSRLSVRFTAADGGTVIDFEHGGWGPGNAASRNHFQDWPEILDGYVRFADQLRR